MSSCGRLYRGLLDAQNESQMRQVFDEYQVGHCYYPRKIKIYDAHTQTLRDMMVRCGKCYNCKQTKINEWCTRMYAHAEDFKNVYFITLTYRSFVSLNSQVSQLIVDRLRDAVWHFDDKNYTHHSSYNPCLLVKSHYQNFLKRLRKNTGINDLTYVMSGEYGHMYGRPHFHLILFTNNHLSLSDVQRAWSVCLWRRNSDGLYEIRKNQKRDGHAYDFPIGRVDFHDLVRNGSFNTTGKIRIDGQYMNVANCFAYVCKYVCKADKANYSRVRIAYDALYHKHTFVKVFNDEVQWSIIRRYLVERGYSHDILDKHTHTLNKYKYEKVVFSPSGKVYADGLSASKQISFGSMSASVPVYPEVYYDFRCVFSPFCQFSRGVPIGSVYSARHLQEHSHGVFNRPILQDQGFVVPSYFRRKVADYLYGLRKCRQTIKSRSYSLGGLVDLFRRLQNSLRYGVALPCAISSKDPTTSVERALQNQYQHYRDAYTGEKIVLYDDHAIHFKYDRHSRQYVQSRSIPIGRWLTYWLSKLSDEFKLHNLNLRIAYQEMETLQLAIDLLETKRPIFDWRKSFIDRSSEERKHMNKIYHAIHKSVE